MIYNDDAYYTGFYRTVRELGAVPALVFNTIAGLLTDGIGEVSNNTICEFIGISERYLIPIVKKLIAEGYIEKKGGNGRGNISIYYLTKKGEQNVPFYEQKRVNKMSKKGEQNVSKGRTKCTPFIYNNNTGINTGGKNVYAGAPAPAPTTTPTQEDFFKFWSLFCPDTSHDQDKENCFAVWQSMSEDSRKTLLNELLAGRRYKKTDNPYWYLKDWKDPLPFVPLSKQGTPEFTQWYNDAHAAGKLLCIIRYPVDPEQPLDKAPLAYCLPENLGKMEAAGAILIRDNA